MLYSRHSVLRQARTCLRQTPPFTTSSSILARLLSTLAILEQREGELKSASLGAVTAGTKLGGTITGFIAGSNVQSVADAAAKVKGLDKIIMVENGAYDKVYALLLRCLGAFADAVGRVYQRILHRYWSRTLRREALHMSLRDTRRLGRT